MKELREGERNKFNFTTCADLGLDDSVNLGSGSPFLYEESPATGQEPPPKTTEEPVAPGESSEVTKERPGTPFTPVLSPGMFINHF